MLIIYLCVLIICYGLSYWMRENTLFNKRILPFLAIVFSIIIIGGSLGDPDNVIYENMYSRGSLSKGVGFEILMGISKSFGLSYHQFRIFVAILANILIFSTVNKFSFSKKVYYCLYLIYPLCFDAVQIRNFLAMSIFVFAIQFLISENKKIMNSILYVLFIVLASTIQITAIAYIPIVFIRHLHDNKYLNLAIKVAIILSIIVGLNRSLVIGLLNKYSILLGFNDYGINNYIAVNNDNGWIINWAQQFANFGLVFSTRKYLQRNKVYFQNINKTNKISILTSYVYNINLYMFLFLPLLILDENYTRIIRNVMPLNCILYSNLFYLAKRKKILIKGGVRMLSFNKEELFIVIYQAILFLLMARTYWQSIVIQLLTNNWII